MSGQAARDSFPARWEGPWGYGILLPSLLVTAGRTRWGWSGVAATDHHVSSQSGGDGPGGEDGQTGPGVQHAIPVGSLKDIAAEVLAIARSGLRNRAQLNAIGDDETGYLAPLDDIVASGKVPAQRLLDLYHGAWNGDLSRLYEEKSF